MTATTFDREYRTVDKSTWGDGPWQGEPDKAQWVDAATGLDCLIVRSSLGALCGYVGVPKAHPWHGVAYSGCVRGECEPDDFDCPHRPESLLNVHGGVTFADECGHGEDESVGICHVPGADRPDELWWFGFDCAHFRDLVPGMLAILRQRRPESLLLPENEPPRVLPRTTYKGVAYVRRECEQMALQLVAVG